MAESFFCNICGPEQVLLALFWGPTAGLTRPVCEGTCALLGGVTDKNSKNKHAVTTVENS